MINKIQAFGRYITVKALESDKKFKSGLHASHTQANLIAKAEVLSAGHYKELNDKVLEPGDTVFVHEFPKDNQIDPVTGEEIMFIRADMVYGYIKKTTKK